MKPTKEKVREQCKSAWFIWGDQRILFRENDISAEPWQMSRILTRQRNRGKDVPERQNNSFEASGVGEPLCIWIDRESSCSQGVPKEGKGSFFFFFFSCLTIFNSNMKVQYKPFGGLGACSLKNKNGGMQQNDLSTFSSETFKERLEPRAVKDPFKSSQLSPPANNLTPIL